METQKNKIEVLCPSKKCRRCERILKRLEKFILNENIDAEIVIVTEIEKLIEKNTWILPTIIINGKIAARGYFPSSQILINNLLTE